MQIMCLLYLLQRNEMSQQTNIELNMSKADTVHTYAYKQITIICINLFIELCISPKLISDF